MYPPDWLFQWEYDYINKTTIGWDWAYLLFSDNAILWSMGIFIPGATHIENMSKIIETRIGSKRR